MQSELFLRVLVCSVILTGSWAQVSVVSLGDSPPVSVDALYPFNASLFTALVTSEQPEVAPVLMLFNLNAAEAVNKFGPLDANQDLSTVLTLSGDRLLTIAEDGSAHVWPVDAAWSSGSTSSIASYSVQRPETDGSDSFPVAVALSAGAPGGGSALVLRGSEQPPQALLRQYDALTGASTRTYSMNGTLVGLVALTESTFAVSDSEGALLALNAATGHELWRKDFSVSVTQGGGGPGMPPPTTTQEPVEMSFLTLATRGAQQVVVAAPTDSSSGMSSTLVALDVNTGAQVASLDMLATQTDPNAAIAVHHLLVSAGVVVAVTELTVAGDGAPELLMWDMASGQRCSHSLDNVFASIDAVHDIVVLSAGYVAVRGAADEDIGVWFKPDVQACNPPDPFQLPGILNENAMPPTPTAVTATSPLASDAAQLQYFAVAVDASVVVFSHCPDSGQGPLASGVCSACTKGHFGENRFGGCQACAAGTYTNSSGADECRACPAGTVAPTSGLSGCTACESGWYAAEDGLATCSQCPPGTYAPSASSVGCLGCQAGTYQPSSAQSSCLPCAQGIASGLEPVDSSRLLLEEEPSSIASLECPFGAVQPMPSALLSASNDEELEYPLDNYEANNQSRYDEALTILYSVVGAVFGVVCVVLYVLFCCGCCSATRARAAEKLKKYDRFAAGYLLSENEFVPLSERRLAFGGFLNIAYVLSLAMVTVLLIVTFVLNNGDVTVVFQGERYVPEVVSLDISFEAVLYSASNATSFSCTVYRCNSECDSYVNPVIVTLPGAAVDAGRTLVSTSSVVTVPTTFQVACSWSKRVPFATAHAMSFRLSTSTGVGDSSVRGWLSGGRSNGTVTLMSAAVALRPLPLLLNDEINDEYVYGLELNLQEPATVTTVLADESANNATLLLSGTEGTVEVGGTRASGLKETQVKAKQTWVQLLSQILAISGGIAAAGAMLADRMYDWYRAARNGENTMGARFFRFWYAVFYGTPLAVTNFGMHLLSAGSGLRWFGSSRPDLEASKRGQMLPGSEDAGALGAEDGDVELGGATMGSLGDANNPRSSTTTPTPGGGALTQYAVGVGVGPAQDEGSGTPVKGATRPGSMRAVGHWMRAQDAALRAGENGDSGGQDAEGKDADGGMPGRSSSWPITRRSWLGVRARLARMEMQVLALQTAALRGRLNAGGIVAALEELEQIKQEQRIASGGLRLPPATTPADITATAADSGGETVMRQLSGPPSMAQARAQQEQGLQQTCTRSAPEVHTAVEMMQESDDEEEAAAAKT